MDWSARYQPQRDQYWPEVEHFFSELPPHLFRQGVLLKNNLATFYADTGQFKDILRRKHDFPLLYLHFWLLDDWRGPANTERIRLEKHLFLAMTFIFAAVWTHDSIRDESSNFDHQYLFLAQALIRQADSHLAQLYPPSAIFWEYHRAYWAEYAEATLSTADRRQTAAAVAGRLAYTKIPVAAIILNSAVPLEAHDETESILSLLCEMVDRLNFVHQTLRDISTLRRDLSQGNDSYPLSRARQEAGLDPQQQPVPEQILGALILTDTVDKIGHECLSALAACRSTASALDLSTFTAYIAAVEALVGEVMAMFSSKNKTGTAKDTSAENRLPRFFFAPYVETLPKVIEMAEGYLLSDLTFRESWEVQRRGAFGVPELTAKAFPSGLIVEIFCRHGRDMSGPVDSIFQMLQATGCRYYDYPQIPPDADDLGLLLRLYPYSGQPAAHREFLQLPLRWLKHNIQESGEIPVWFTGENDAPEAIPGVSLWGQSCITVAANVLLGLIDYDFWGYYQRIEKSARYILERWASQGLSATLHYVPLYSLWIAFELVGKLAASPLETVLQSHLNQAAQVLGEQLQTQTKQPYLTPQEAAFLTLACLSDGCPLPANELFSPRWITILCKSQRYDGSWADEPLFGTPTRGELATWYASRSITTAYCYHALKTYQPAKDILSSSKFEEPASSDAAPLGI